MLACRDCLHGVYLDSVVRQRFEGQLFDLPTVMHARILNLAPGDSISIQEVRNELDVLNYRKVRTSSYLSIILFDQD